MAKTKPKVSVHVPAFLKDAVNARLDDQKGKEGYPTLFALLAPVYDGKVLTYQPGKMTLRIEGANYVVVLDSPTAVLQTRVCLPSLDGLLDALERHLASGNAVWMPGWKKGGKPLPTVDGELQ